MKKLLFFALAAMLAVGCSKSKVKDIAAFEFNNAWYWVVQHEEGTTQQEVEDYVNLMANPNQTSFFFVYDNSVDASNFTKNKFNLKSFSTVVTSEPRPKYGLYKLPSDPKIYNDGFDIIQLAIENK